MLPVIFKGYFDQALVATVETLAHHGARSLKTLLHGKYGFICLGQSAMKQPAAQNYPLTLDVINDIIFQELG